MTNFITNLIDNRLYLEKEEYKNNIANIDNSLSINNLSENSVSYYSQSDIYKKFSNAEDYPDLIFKHLSPLFHNKTVLDLGCGNGKYSIKISSLAQSIYSIDKSYSQLKQIENKPDNMFPILSDGAAISFASDTFDIVFSSWMLGTINDVIKQEKILNEAKRVLKKGGRLILIENHTGSQFESLRGRYPDPLHRTHNYNNWLLSQEMKIDKIINTYFQFDNKDDAQHVFHSIWKERLTNIIESHKIDHNVVIFEYIKT